MYRREMQPKLHGFNLSIDRLIRPSPKYFPKRLWFWLQSKFINFPAGHEYWTEKMKELRGYIPDYWPEAQRLKETGVNQDSDGTPDQIQA